MTVEAIHEQNIAAAEKLRRQTEEQNQGIVGTEHEEGEGMLTGLSASDEAKLFAWI